MRIYHVCDDRFRAYGSVVSGYDFSELLEAMRRYPIPREPERIKYVAADPELEKLDIFRQFGERFYGGLPIELGYCMGHNSMLNALEYHRSSEVNVAVTDYVVMVGRRQDIAADGTYDTSLVEMFYVPERLAIEYYATTLHYCACHVHEDGYAHATFLPRGTNTRLGEGFVPITDEDKLLSRRNKWMLVHGEGGFTPEKPVRLRGENLRFDPSQVDLELTGKIV
jgi:hypothetical protein